MTTLAESGISSGNRKKPKRLEVLIVGGVGSWKTTTAHQMPRTRTIDFDDGLQSVEWAILAGKIDKRLEDIVYETVLPKKPGEEGMADMLDRASDYVDQWIEEEDEDPTREWDTLIVDSASFMMDGAIGLALTENKRVELSKSLDVGRAGIPKKRRDRGLYIVPMRIQDWGSAGSLFMKAVRQWRSLGKNLIITAHEYAEIDEDTGAITAIRPNVVGQLRTKLPASMDEVWYTKVKIGKRDEDAKVFFRLQQEAKREAKSRLGCLGIECEANFPKMRSVIAEFYSIGEDMLWQAYHGREGRDQAEREIQNSAITV